MNSRCVGVTSSTQSIFSGCSTGIQIFHRVAVLRFDGGGSAWRLPSAYAQALNDQPPVAGSSGPYRSTKYPISSFLQGEDDRAAAELAEARKLSRDDRFSSLARLKPTGLFGSGSWGVPKVSGLFEATYFAGLRKAGMPVLRIHFVGDVP
jgi:hypothetical protein